MLTMNEPNADAMLDILIDCSVIVVAVMAALALAVTATFRLLRSLVLRRSANTQQAAEGGILPFPDPKSASSGDARAVGGNWRRVA